MKPPHKPLVGGSNPAAATFYTFYTVSEYPESTFNGLLFR